MRPDLVSGIILGAGVIALSIDKDPRNLPLTLQNDTLRRTITSATVSNPYLTKLFLSGFVHVKDAITPTKVKVLQEPMVRYGYTEALSNWMSVLLMPQLQALSNLKDPWQSLDLPVFFFWAQAETITLLDQAHALVRLVNGAEFVILEGVGHISRIEAPEAFQTTLLAALTMINKQSIKR